MLRQIKLLLTFVLVFALFPQEIFSQVSQNSQWSWRNGQSSGAMVRGQKGVASSGYNPGKREGAIQFKDPNGNLWLYGGLFNGNMYGDLWFFNAATDEWTWVSGSNQVNADAVFGTFRNGDQTTYPGGRFESFSWYDPSSQKLWLYGGGTPGTGAQWRDDLWSYDLITGIWTWMAGSTTKNVAPNGVVFPSPNNTPGARSTGVSWYVYNSLNPLESFVSYQVPPRTCAKLYLAFGYAPGGGGQRQDIWVYNTDDNNWMFLGGAYPIINGLKSGPSFREGAAAWSRSETFGEVVAREALYCYGGYGTDQNLGFGAMNDMWKYDVKLNKWHYVSGSYFVNPPSSNTNPGTTWKMRADISDDKSKVYLYSPQGANNLWEYNCNTELWSQISPNAATNYGIQRGQAANVRPGNPFNGNLWYCQNRLYTLVNGNTFCFFDPCTPGNTITASTNSVNDLSTPVTFTCSVSGSGITYQWQKNGININGATNSTFTTNGIYSTDVFQCVVTSNAPCASGIKIGTPSNAISIQLLLDPPPCTTIISPTNGETNVYTNGPLHWNPSPDATHYDVFVSTNNAQSFFQLSTVTGTSIFWTGVPPNAKSWWYVVPKKSIGNNQFVSAVGCAAGATSFTTGPSVVNDSVCNAKTMQLNAPAFCDSNFYATARGDAFGGCSTPQTTTWYKYTPAVSGQVQFTFSPPPSGDTLRGWVGCFLVTGGSCPSPTLVDSTTTTFGACRFYTGSGGPLKWGAYLIAGKTYYFRVSGSGADVGRYCFSIETPPPPPTGCTTPVLPANGAAGVSSGRFTWTAVPDATEYDLYLGTTPQSMAVVRNTTLTDAIVSTLLPATTYYWAAVPRNPGGPASGCLNSPANFTTGQAPPNDLVCNAIPLTLDGPADCQNTTLASATGDVAGQCYGANNTTWYRYTPTVSGSVQFLLEPPANGDTLNGWVGAFVQTGGSCPSSLTLADSTTVLFSTCRYYQRSLGNATRWEAHLTAGKTYYFRVSGIGVAIGQYCFSIQSTAITNVKSGDWGDPGTWSNNRVPTELSNVVLKYPVTVSSNGVCKTLTIETGGSLLVKQGVELRVVKQ